MDVGRGQDGEQAIISLNIAPELLKTRSIGPATYCEVHNNRPKLFHFSYCFQGDFCKLPLLRVIFNRKLSDYCAILSKYLASVVSESRPSSQRM